MKQNMSRSDVALRGVLYVSIAMLLFLNGDETFRAYVPKIALTATGAIAAGLIALRAFIDQSTSQTAAAQAPDAPTPVAITNDSDSPVPVQESENGLTEQTKTKLHTINDLLNEHESKENPKGNSDDGAN